jgi:hypothetical protein
MINYGIIIKSISTLIYTVWHVDKYKITFKLVIDHWPRAWRLRNTGLAYQLSHHFCRLLDISRVLIGLRGVFKQH